MAEKKVKNKGGAPTKYKEEYCEKIIEYFRVPPVVVEYIKEYHSNGTLKCEKPVARANEFPTFQGFADYINVNVDTLNEWCKVHEEFSVAYARAKQIQEKIWLINGMNNLYNAQFAQFFGKNCLGYKDKQEIDSNVNLTYEDALKKAGGDEY